MRFRAQGFSKSQLSGWLLGILARAVSSGYFRPGPALEPSKKGMWDFPKIRVPYCGVLRKKDPTIECTVLGSPIVGNPQKPQGMGI